MTLEFTGNPTEVLIVGSQHIGASVSDEMLQSTFSRLRAWRPDIVAIEVLPGEVVGLFHQQGGWLAELKYGGFPVALKLGQLAQAFTGWTRVQAARQAEQTEDARTRVLAYLAAFEPYNALLSWMPDMELPAELAAGLADLAQEKSERMRLGMKLARALGHTRVALLDDFPLYEMRRDWWAEFEAGYQTPEFKAWIEAHPHVRDSQQASEQMKAAGDYSVVLDYLNSPEGMQENNALETGANFLLGLPGRAKQADWDARNLFMAARLRLETARIPGGRLLFIVGNSHRAPMEAALRVAGPDLRVVNFAELDA